MKSARRTIETLELFAETHRSASVSEVAAYLDAPMSSTSVLLAGLARLGYLEQDPVDRRYRPTLRVMLLGAWLQDRLFGESSLLRLAEGLRTTTGMTVLIGVQRGASVQYILTLRRSVSEGGGHMRAGMLRPMTRAAVGKALLFGMTDQEVGRILRRANAEEKDASNRIPTSRFLTNLRAERAAGWAESSGAVRPGLSVIAVPLPLLAGQPPLAIGLGGEQPDIEAGKNILVNALKKACKTLAQESATAAHAPTGGVGEQRAQRHRQPNKTGC
ncbi:helix-turn-helix domain-containing protein [Muricoccus aerilatus]|uniref:IclR family transcriptional regulator n=1 Tax=Muricoccus aerilatus TaxID=452982 RepID=UPI0014701074